MDAIQKCPILVPRSGEGVLQVDAIDPVQIWMNPPGISIIPETNTLISQIKTYDTLPHPRVASWNLRSWKLKF
jgi:hypothetical protein